METGVLREYVRKKQLQEAEARKKAAKAAGTSPTGAGKEEEEKEWEPANLHLERWAVAAAMVGAWMYFRPEETVPKLESRSNEKDVERMNRRAYEEARAKAKANGEAWPDEENAAVSPDVKSKT